MNTKVKPIEENADLLDAWNNYVSELLRHIREIKDTIIVPYCIENEVGFACGVMHFIDAETGDRFEESKEIHDILFKLTPDGKYVGEWMGSIHLERVWIVR